MTAVLFAVVSVLCLTVVAVSLAVVTHTVLTHLFSSASTPHRR